MPRVALESKPQNVIDTQFGRFKLVPGSGNCEDCALQYGKLRTETAQIWCNDLLRAAGVRDDRPDCITKEGGHGFVWKKL